MSALTLWDCEEWHDEDGGSAMALHIAGHVDLADATALAWAWMIEHERSTALRRGGPRHVWLRKVPWHKEEEGSYGGWDGQMQYVISRQGRGATPVTYIEFAHAWDSKRCHRWPACHEPAQIGYPPSRFIDPPPDVEYLYFCREHAREIEERLAQARREARAA